MDKTQELLEARIVEINQAIVNVVNQHTALQGRLAEAAYTLQLYNEQQVKPIKGKKK